MISSIEICLFQINRDRIFNPEFNEVFKIFKNMLKLLNLKCTIDKNMRQLFTRNRKILLMIFWHRLILENKILNFLRKIQTRNWIWDILSLWASKFFTSLFIINILDVARWNTTFLGTIVMFAGLRIHNYEHKIIMHIRDILWYSNNFFFQIFRN